MSLYEPYDLGSLRLANRIVMSSMTRNRARWPEATATEPTAEYFAQRATAGLMVTGSTAVSPQGRGYLWTEGLHTDEQAAAWRTVTDAVHGRGGHIAVQLIHTGRVSHASLQPGGTPPPGASEVPARAEVLAWTTDGTPGLVPAGAPRAMTTEEVRSVAADFGAAAERAVAAGFDAVEIQAANGFLFDQFFDPNVNDRTDAYGGSAANRIRLLLEVTEAAAEAGLPVGVKVTPNGVVNGAAPFDDWRPLYLRVAAELARLGAAYLNVTAQASFRERNGLGPAFGGDFLADVREAYHGTLILGGGYDGPSAEKAVADGTADMVAFARSYVANPDLVDRLRTGHPLAEADLTKLYGGGAEGYTDYPTMAEEAAAH
ncbi:alkene reductase [Actinoallomurus vinaceus]|uniref:Alkene reductase n=1 Tax=Actinoallomurus vinaceus TaxID=1080074 RepID=A0ABP8U5P1_9ACTN